MSENLNATCSICNKKYHVCRSCSDIQSFQPWRTVCDTLPHYMIYLALAEYTKTKDKVSAKKELEKCDLSELNIFDEDVKKVIEEIMAENKANEVKSAFPQKIAKPNVKKIEQNKEK